MNRHLRNSDRSVAYLRRSSKLNKLESFRVPVGERKAYSTSHQIDAPVDLRLLPSPEVTLEFVRELRALGHEVEGRPELSIFINLDRVKDVNYATISILKALAHLRVSTK
jgi:hypothetical protein